MSATPCPTCSYPASGGPHTPPDGCIDFLRRSLAASDASLAHCQDHVRGLQHQLRWEWDKADRGVSP